MGIFNETRITKVAATVLELLGVEKNDNMADSIKAVTDAVTSKMGGCDRVFMYNPDAIAMWIYEKYKSYFDDIEKNADLKLDMLSVVPPVTPACFGSMYSGLMPAEHGIQKYEKPVLKVDTIFDELPKAGKKVAIVSTAKDSISLIFLEREIDYFIYPTKEECNSKAMQLIKEDNYDVIVLYNADFDYNMHRFSPEGKRTLKALRENIETYGEIREAIKRTWKPKGHKTALAFAPDHGCHRMLGILGTHGKEIPEDMNIIHFWTLI